MTKYIYCFIRKDISEVQRVIQLGHVCFEAGALWGGDIEPPHMCLFEVEDHAELIEAYKYLNKYKIENEIFYEPAWAMGFTAICTAPIEDDTTRKLMEGFRLYGRDKPEMVEPLFQSSRRGC